MARTIPKASRKRLLRLISARADLDYAVEAYHLLQGISLVPVRYHIFVSLVVAYCRPFTESEGIGSLRCEYPDYPDFEDAEMNVRHQRMLDIRNKFLGHSSLYGTQAFLLAPGSRNPATGETVTSYKYAVGKRQFLHPEFIQWLAPVIDALAIRLDNSLEAACAEIGAAYLSSGEIFELDKTHKDFTWNIPKKAPAAGAASQSNPVIATWLRVWRPISTAVDLLVASIRQRLRRKRTR